MTGDRSQGATNREDGGVPDPLQERVEALFVSYRGYEPRSFQEALGAVCDLAAARIGGDQAGAVGNGHASRHSIGGALADAGSEGPKPTTVDPGPIGSVEPVLETGNADAVVRELATEVLDEMTADAFEDLEHGVDEGTGEGIADGMGAVEAADGEDHPSGGTEELPDSLSADPESDCALCGQPYRVSVLETTILADDGSVALVCPNCET